MEMQKGTKVIYDKSKTDIPKWENHVIDGTEDEEFLDNISFIEVDKETGEYLIEL